MTLARYWRINVTGNAYSTANPSDASVSMAEVVMAGVAGGPSLATGGTATASAAWNSSYLPESLVDGDPATAWSSRGIPAWWQYDFGLRVLLAEIRITAPPSVPAMAPGTWSLLWSNDGSTWTHSADYVSSTWTAGQTQTFVAGGGSSPGGTGTPPPDILLTATFTISLSEPSLSVCAVDYATADETAMQPGDYTPVAGTVTFAAGEVAKTVLVPVLADPAASVAKAFMLVLSNPINCALPDVPSNQCTIST